MELCMEIHFSPILYSESYQIEKIDIWAQWINFLAFMAFLALWLKLTSLYGLYSGEKFFIGFLAELGNFKHFEPYLFFGKFWPFLALWPLWPSKAKKNFFGRRARQTASNEQIKIFWATSSLEPMNKGCRIFKKFEICQKFHLIYNHPQIWWIYLFL